MKTFNLPAPQFLFNYIANHLLTQNKVSANSEGRCRYRQGDLKCAAGAIISDDVYDPKMEGKRARSPRLHEAFISSLGRDISGEEMNIISDLQIMHDTQKPWNWKNDLKYLAKKYSLTFNL